MAFKSVNFNKRPTILSNTLSGKTVGYSAEYTGSGAQYTLEIPIEVLVVAGGGSGAANVGSGGGAGGFRTLVEFAYGDTNYPISVGAGGGPIAPTSGRGANGGNSNYKTTTCTGGG